MNSQRVVGIVLLVVGVALLVAGVNASHSLADSVSNTFTGHFTQNTTWYIIGGIVSGVTGLLMLLRDIGGKHA